MRLNRWPDFWWYIWKTTWFCRKYSIAKIGTAISKHVFTQYVQVPIWNLPIIKKCSILDKCTWFQWPYSIYATYKLWRTSNYSIRIFISFIIKFWKGCTIALTFSNANFWHCYLWLNSNKPTLHDIHSNRENTFVKNYTNFVLDFVCRLCRTKPNV